MAKKWRRSGGGRPPLACAFEVSAVTLENQGGDAYITWVGSPEPVEWYVGLEREIAPGVWNVEVDTSVAGVASDHTFVGPMDPATYRAYVRALSDGTSCGLRSAEEVFA